MWRSRKSRQHRVDERYGLKSIIQTVLSDTFTAMRNDRKRMNNFWNPWGTRPISDRSVPLRTG